MKKYSTIIFDLDNTLLDASYPITSGLIEIFEQKENKVLDISLIREILNKPKNQILTHFGVSDENIDEYLSLWNTQAEKYKEKTIFFNDIITLLNKLQELNIECGIVSKKSRKLFNTQLSFLNIDYEKYFSYIVLGDDTEQQKPNPAPLFRYLLDSKRKANECLYIGDTYSDYLCAKNAGIDFGLSSWNYTPEIHNHSKEFYYTFENPLDVLNLFK